MTLHFLNDVVNDIESTLDNDVIIPSLKTESTSKLINRITCSRLLISSLPGSARECMLNRSASLAMSTSVLKA